MNKDFLERMKEQMKGEGKKVLMKKEKIDGKNKDFFLQKIKGNEIYWNDYISEAIIFNDKNEVAKCISENYGLLREAHKIYVIETEVKIEVKKCQK